MPTNDLFDTAWRRRAGAGPVVLVGGARPYAHLSLDREGRATNGWPRRGAKVDGSAAWDA